MKAQRMLSDAEVTQLGHERALRALRGERDDARRRAAMFEGKFEELQAQFDQLAAVRQPVTVRPFGVGRSSSDSRGVSLVMWSDWHVAERVNARMVGGRNRYDLDVARQRAETCVASTIRIHRHLAKSYTVPEMVLFLGGDFITGYLHPELEQTNLLGPVEEARFAQELLVGCLRKLAEERSIKQLRIVCMRGNHGRTTKKMQFKNDYGTSLESFIYWTLQDLFKSKRITVEVPEADVHEAEIIKGWTLRMYHGHQVKYNDGVGGLTIPLNKWQAKQDRTQQADFNLMGHYHTYSIPNPRTILNGSLKGWDEYAMSHGFPYQEPLQSFALLDVRRRFVAQHLPIFCS